MLLISFIHVPDFAGLNSIKSKALGMSLFLGKRIMKAESSVEFSVESEGGSLFLILTEQELKCIVKLQHFHQF